MPTQVQLFYQEQRRIGRVDRQFLSLVHDGLTREELDRCIQRRPQLWSRYSSYRHLLPTSASVPDSGSQSALTRQINHMESSSHEL